MSEPCLQEGNITSISKTLERMENAQDIDRKERRESEKRLMSVLERLADQAVRINHLEETVEEYYSSDKVTSDRLRDIELTLASSGPAVRQQTIDTIQALSSKLDVAGNKVDKLNRFFNYTTHRYAIIAYAATFGMVLLGTALDLIYHMNTIRSIIRFFQGGE